jgi:carotenoid 1,2-hydratase
MSVEKPAKPETFSFASSVKADVWHPKSDSVAYEWWYFDALSDDGKDAIVVIFLDNFVFSPRYNAFCRKQEKAKGKRQKAKDESHISESNNQSQESQSKIQNPKPKIEGFPAIAFVYYHNGKPLYRAINEFAPENFSAETDSPACSLGESSFKFESAPYGSGYILSIKANLRRGRKLEAKLEWLSIESDLLPHKDFGDLRDKHTWNLVASRSDVTGSIKVTDDKKKTLDVRHFRGTGYHDHNTDARWLPQTVKDWQWGRAHFTDATAVYYRYRELEESEAVVKLFLIKNNQLEMYDAYCQEKRIRRSIFGVKFPKELTFSTENGIELNITQLKPIDESFFYLRFLSEAKLKCPDGAAHEAFAITEHLAPKALKYRWLDWLVNMRIGRNDKGSFL